MFDSDGASLIYAEIPGDRPSGFFNAGSLTFTSGANSGRRIEVLRHVRNEFGDHVELWQPMVAEILPGDGFTISAGCDKHFETCRDRFANIANFRGFPHMPGNDFALSYPTSAEANDGESLQ